MRNEECSFPRFISTLKGQTLKVFSCLFFVGAIVLWFFWPRIHPGLETSYSSLQALVAVIGSGIALLSYNLGKDRSRRDDFKNLELQIMNGIFPLINEYDIAIGELEYKGYKGAKVLTYFFDKYRVRELELLCALREAKDDSERALIWAKLEDFDKDFMAEAECLRKPHGVLSRSLNWIKAQTEYMESLFNDRPEEVDAARRRVLHLIEGYMAAGHRFVMGKFRDLDYPSFKTGSFRDSYRGFRYADLLFRNVRTLAHISFSNYSEAIRYWNLMQLDYSLPQDTKKRLDIWFNPIHCLCSNDKAAKKIGREGFRRWEEKRYLDAKPWTWYL